MKIILFYLDYKAQCLQLNYTIKLKLKPKPKPQLLSQFQMPFYLLTFWFTVFHDFVSPPFKRQPFISVNFSMVSIPQQQPFSFCKRQPITVVSLSSLLCLFLSSQYINTDKRWMIQFRYLCSILVTDPYNYSV